MHDTCLEALITMGEATLLQVFKYINTFHPDLFSSMRYLHYLLGAVHPSHYVPQTV